MWFSRHLKISPLFIFFNIIIILLILLNLKFNTPFLYFWMWALIIFELADVVFAVLQRLKAKNIFFERQLPDKANEYESISAGVFIKNMSGLSVYNVCIEDSLGRISRQKTKRFLASTIPGKGVLEFGYLIYCTRRGRYVIGPIEVYFFDLLGMFSFKKSYPVNSLVYVYPQTFAIRTFPPLTKGNLPWFGVETRRVSGDDDEFFGTREYRQGDPIKRIHWLSTARKNQLIVKEFQSFSFYKATLVFVLNKEENVGSNKECVAEYIVKIGSSIAKYLLENGISLQIVAHAGRMFDIGPNRGIQYLDETMKFFASIEPESRITLGTLSEQLSAKTCSDSTLIIISTDKSAQDLGRFLYLGSYNTSIIPIVLLSFSFSGYAFSEEKSMYMERTHLDTYARAGINPFFVSKGDNLENIFVL